MFNSLMLRGLLAWRPRGILDQRKVDKIVAFVTEQENRFGKSFNRFIDISRLDSVDLSFNYVFHVALYRRLSRRGRTIIKSAFLVPNVEVSRYIRLHALLTDYSPLKVRIFKERSCREMARCSSCITEGKQRRQKFKPCAAYAERFSDIRCDALHTELHWVSSSSLFWLIKGLCGVCSG